MLERPADVAALEPEWWELWRADPRATPFQSPAWVLPWAPSFGHEPCVLALRDAGRLRALLPLFRLRTECRPALLLLGSGNTDYLDGLFAPGWAERACAELARDVARLGTGVERVDLQGLRADSPLRALSLGAGWREEARVADACLVHDLAPELPPARARRLRHYERRLARLGTVELERADERSLERMLAELAALHGARWNARGEPGVLADPRVTAFLGRAAARLLAAGMLRLYALRVGGRPAALVLGLAARGWFGYYLTAFDPELARANPGEVLLGRIRAAERAGGAAELDFLRGRERYKHEWGVTERPLHQLVLRPTGA